jgi:membrane-bound metal-dependent hydrolase YbcI (DUF457 family)
MNFGGHLITGWLCSQGRGFTLGERRFITLTGIAPDIDGTIFFLPGYLEHFHRTFGHNIFFGLSVPLLALVIFGRKRGLLVLPFAYIAMAFHYFLDLLVTGWWDFRPLWPISDAAILMSNYIPEDVMKYWIQLSLIVILFSIVIWRYRKTHRTPLEVITPGFDRFVTTFITYPFHHKCNECNARAFYRHPETSEPVCGKHVRHSMRGIFFG